MPTSPSLMVPPGPNLRPRILNVISFPALYPLRVGRDHKLPKPFLGQIKVGGHVDKGREEISMDRGNWFSA